MAEAARAAAEAKEEAGSDAAMLGDSRKRRGRRRSVVQEQMDLMYHEMRAKDAKVELFPFVR